MGRPAQTVSRKPGVQGCLQCQTKKSASLDTGKQGETRCMRESKRRNRPGIWRWGKLKGFSKSLGSLTGLTAKGHKATSANGGAHRVKSTANGSASSQEAHPVEPYRVGSLLPATNPDNTWKVPPTQRCVTYSAHGFYPRQLTRAHSTITHQNSKQQCGQTQAPFSVLER